MKRSFRLLLYDISLVWECISSGCVSPATSSHSHVLSASLTPSVCDLSLPLFPGKLSPSHYSVRGLSVPRWELLQPCDNERSPFRSSLHINGSPAEAAARRVGAAVAAGANAAMGMECCTEQDTSRVCLSFKAEQSGGRKVGKRPALLMLQDSMVSMTTPAAFFSLGWMPRRDCWHSNHILAGWGSGRWGGDGCWCNNHSGWGRWEGRHWWSSVEGRDSHMCHPVSTST